jgi:hypothetical protein
VIDARKEVPKMLQKATFRRLLIVATMLAALAAASPLAALAENVGNGP